jgi:hypothetical protein
VAVVARRKPKSAIDPAAAEAAKAAGMARAERSAAPEWWNFMLEAALAVARLNEYLTTDHVEDWRRSHGGPTTPERRALGPLMRTAARRGYFEKTGRVERSGMRVCHARDKAVWRSLVYQGAGAS